MNWLTAIEHLRTQRKPGVIVTVAAVRGHAPRLGGAKMVVSADQSWDTIGGGNLEETATHRARTMIAEGTRQPELITLQLSDKTPALHGVQCCGGEVTMLLEPIRVIPSVAIFGIGHVGLELARILARHDIDLHLVDARPSMLAEDRLAVLSDARSTLTVHAVPVPETSSRAPPTHALIMTHDHAGYWPLRRRPKSAASIVDRLALKWQRFQKNWLNSGSEEDMANSDPIGIPGIIAKAGGNRSERGCATLQAFEAMIPQAKRSLELIHPRTNSVTNPSFGEAELKVGHSEVFEHTRVARDLKGVPEPERNRITDYGIGTSLIEYFSDRMRVTRCHEAPNVAGILGS
jgi:xanthine dehydrogenase accessory factor